MSIFQELLLRLSSINPELITFRTVCAMLILAAIFVVFILIYRGQRLYHFASYFLTTLGILGTFVGITIGLLNFNTQDIDGSIPALLEGLKMAFITSIVGMSLALIVRLWAESIKYVFESRRSQTLSRDEPVTPAEILGALRIQLSVLEDIRNDIKQGHKLIAGEGDSSVVTNLHKLRAEVRDELKTVSQSNVGMLQAVEKARIAIAGEGDSSVVTQLQRAREDIVEGFKSTQKALLDEDQSVNASIISVRSDMAAIGQQLTALDSLSLISEIRDGIKHSNELIAGGKDDSVIASLHKLHSDLTEPLQVIAQHTHALHESTEKTHLAIAGGDDSSIISQLHKARGEIISGFESNQNALLADEHSVNASLIKTQNTLDTIEQQLTALDSLSLISEIRDDIRHSNELIAGGNEDSVIASLHKLHSDLTEPLQVVAQHTHALHETSEKTHLAIAGGEDSSIISQLHKARGEIISGFESNQNALLADEHSVNASLAGLRSDLDVMGSRVAEEFHAFAEQVSEIGTKQFIQALEQAIRDFNDKLTEQFGENFKRLDESVQKLVVWQENYKEQLLEMDSQFKRTIEGVQTTENSLGLIVGHTEAIPLHMSSLESIIRTSDAQLQDLDGHLEAFVDMKDKAAEAMPEIQKCVDDVMEQVRDAVKKASDHYEIMLTDASELVAEFNQSWLTLHEQFTSETQEAVGGISEALNETSSELTKGAEEIRDQLKDSASQVSQAAESLGSDMQSKLNQIFESLAQEIDRNSNGLNAFMNKAMGETNDHINELIQQLDKGMQQELERALQEMANQLGSISNKFVNDYTRLTDAVEHVLEQNKRLAS